MLTFQSVVDYTVEHGGADHHAVCPLAANGSELVLFDAITRRRPRRS